MHTSRSPLAAIVLSQASGVPYYRQLFDQIAALIQSGHLEPGTRLPSVRRLATQTLVSVITIRRTYDDLHKTGLIRRVQGKGTFVAIQVEEASQERAAAEGRRILLEAAVQARLLGLTPETQHEILRQVWQEWSFHAE